MSFVNILTFIASLVMLKAQDDWWVTVDKLTTLLRTSADQLFKDGNLSAKGHHKYFMSGIQLFKTTHLY